MYKVKHWGLPATPKINLLRNDLFDKGRQLSSHVLHRRSFKNPLVVVKLHIQRGLDVVFNPTQSPIKAFGRAFGRLDEFLMTVQHKLAQMHKGMTALCNAEKTDFVDMPA